MDTRVPEHVIKSFVAFFLIHLVMYIVQYLVASKFFNSLLILGLCPTILPKPHANFAAIPLDVIFPQLNVVTVT